MSLQLRLTLVILAVVAVMGVVSLVSLRMNESIERQLADLDRTSSEALDAHSAVGEALAIEGEWDGATFRAEEIERLPRSRRPKLRGSIEVLDPSARSLTLYGREIRMATETEIDAPESTRDPFAALAPGVRVEVSCRVEPDGRWFARKIEARGVKSSDKIKGTVSAASQRSSGEVELSIDGLAVVVPQGVEMDFPRGPLYRMELATQLTSAIEEALAAAQVLVEQRSRERTLRAAGERARADDVERGVEDAQDRLEDSLEEFTHYLAESRTDAEEGRRVAAAHGLQQGAAAELESIELWLAPLEEARATFEHHVRELIALAGPDPEAAKTFLQGTFEPALRTQVAPRVRSWLVEIEEELEGELQAIAQRAGRAAHLLIATNLVGVVLAVGAGLVAARSISGPIVALGRAVQRAGRGDLEARVEVKGKDEVAEVAEAFNRMAAELSATTVSMARLDNVFDSMAGALFVVSADGRIASVNTAALALLGFGRGELLGAPFERVCPDSGTCSASASEERSLRRKDGAAIPVSFSSAELHGAGEGGARVCLALDLSERKRIEEELRRSLAEKELLLREVHHRVKNNLQVISSLLDLQSRSITDPDSLVRFQESQDRIRSMVFIHDQLHRTDELESVDLRSYLELLVAHLAQSHADPEGRIRLRTELEELRLDLDRALACGLIVNELVTNALKHAFPVGAQGEVVVSCRELSGGQVALEVSDDGRGFDLRLAHEPSLSLGLNLVSTLVLQLRGELRTSAAGGSSFRIEFPAHTVQEVA
jgi:PAS domain S-box-containing protein